MQKPTSKSLAKLQKDFLRRAHDAPSAGERAYWQHMYYTSKQIQEELDELVEDVRSGKLSAADALKSWGISDNDDDEDDEFDSDSWENDEDNPPK